jgi:hypothetical protein
LLPYSLACPPPTLLQLPANFYEAVLARGCRGSTWRKLVPDGVATASGRKIQINVTPGEVQHSSCFSSYASYKVTVTSRAGRVIKTLDRRFSDFERLVSELKKGGVSVSTSLPPKTYLRR